MKTLADLFEPPFEILEPQRLSAPFVFNSPHSGATYPTSFVKASKLDSLTLRRSEDTFVDELFLPAVELGAPLMRAHFPRAYLDVNREPYELDPKMFTEPLPPFANTRSLRVAGGLGTIARVVADAHEIYARPLSVEEGLARIERLYKPYHAALGELIERVRAAFGICILIDCHSMPSAGRAGEVELRPDFVLGDRYGTSCLSALTDWTQESLRRLGYVVGRNKPYAGGYITEHYGDPVKGVHALQIEVNRALYMDEARYTRARGFARVTADLAALFGQMKRLPWAPFLSGRAAAE
jgi:N-formylglutamate amidohydrolase